jgi:hypothetical protein
VAGGTSAMIKLRFGMPSGTVAIAYNSRSLRFRDVAIELQTVSSRNIVSKGSQKRALSNEIGLTPIPPVLIAKTTSGRAAQPQSCHRRPRHPLFNQANGASSSIAMAEMRETSKTDGKARVVVCFRCFANYHLVLRFSASRVFQSLIAFKQR